jgi:hypothetical protein
VNPPPAPPSSTKGYTDALSLQGGIESRGVTYKGTHKPITSATCVGEPRYGSRMGGYPLEYHRFNCVLLDASYNMYNAEVVITKSNSQYFWWQVVSISRSG